MWWRSKTKEKEDKERRKKEEDVIRNNKERKRRNPTKRIYRSKNTNSELTQHLEFTKIPEGVISYVGIDKAHIIKEDIIAPTYDITFENQDYMKNLVNSVNKYLEITSRIVPDFTPYYIDTDKLVFDHDYYYNIHLFSALPEDFTYDVIQQKTTVTEKIFTPTMKVSKFPYTVSFYSDYRFSYNDSGDALYDQVYGTISIDKNGSPGRYEINHWNKNDYHQIICKDFDGHMDVAIVYHKDNLGRMFRKFKR